MPNHDYIEEFIKRITSVDWRTSGTKSEARRLLKEFESQTRQQVIEEVREKIKKRIKEYAEEDRYTGGYYIYALKDVLNSLSKEEKE